MGLLTRNAKKINYRVRQTSGCIRAFGDAAPQRKFKNACSLDGRFGPIVGRAKGVLKVVSGPADRLGGGTMLLLVSLTPAVLVRRADRARESSAGEPFPFAG